VSNGHYTSDKNIAVIGCGDWGKNLVRNFAELGVLHTICDTDAGILERMTRLYPDVNTEDEYQQVLNSPEIKGVVIAIPAALHYSMTKQALLADKDTFVEKPLALSITEGKELVDLAQENHRILMVGHILEYHPAVVKLQEMVGKGILGKIQYIYSNRLKLGKFRSQENVIWSLAPHDVSVILLLLNNTTPWQVSTHGGCYLRQNVADVALSTLSFDYGVKAYVFVSWLHPFKEQRFVVVGDKAMIVFNDADPKDKLFYYDHPVEWNDREPTLSPCEAEVIEVAPGEPLRIECQDFIQCIKSRQKPRADGDKGLQVLDVLSRCQNSLQEEGVAQ